MLELNIEKIVAGGYGLARDAQGVILVAGALPGETVLADVKEGKGVRRGVTRDVLSASRERVEAARLPTINFSHARYEAQLRFKRDVVQEALSRIAKLDGEVAQTVPSPREWAYRGGAQYLIRGERLAYRERQGHTPVTVEHDPLVIEAIVAFLERVDLWRLDGARELVVRASLQTGEVLAALIGEGAPRAFRRAAEALLDAGASGVSLAPPAERRFSRGETLLAGEPTILERYGDYDLSVSATGFAQVNPLAAGELYRAVGAQAPELPVTAEAVDLYGGAGGLGLHLARRFSRVTVLDVAPEALRRGERDAQRLALSNVRFVQGNASEAQGADLIVVDPPRSGLEAAARYAVQHSRASHLVYVSCDPATWARDVGEFTRQGWILRSATPYDFYPQTSHVEVLSLLER
ncbi:class I SAM-dependent RNA methyltransferase [Deinococcus peraridilitoris]|uniref:SAM-dependent methyltransferase, tRNA(Uracil-5)-methyltransferase n=1 Tax=Deinococcus peraridilitoris (strain DSM 19664 / LMG 22246 / CIP 109416 / KR-200) TaxID=937777 RepID=L0A528_DEIPD|nr:methyltransferase domain-containing protein [Deinococcus peraridilitoris]AFZ68544.1 SAM-dependent methyltransferase, tRNA(uracil-5)-methyltransferase [Deinococcus peraridilitoris DSM 19664]